MGTTVVVADRATVVRIKMPWLAYCLARSMPLQRVFSTFLLNNLSFYHYIYHFVITTQSVGYMKK